MLMPENAVLHEQKAQVLLEIGDAWNAVKAATRAFQFYLPLGFACVCVFAYMYAFFLLGACA